MHVLTETSPAEIEHPWQKADRRAQMAAQLNPHPILEFSGDGQLTYFNEAAAELARSLGFRTPAEFLPEKTVPVVRLCRSSGLKKPPFETRVSERTLSWFFFPVPQDHVVHCGVTDVTERQHLETQLRYAQKLESVGRLAGGVAHDFNNVLTVIQGHVGLLRAHPHLTPDMADSLQAISRASERATRLTSQLLIFSRKSRWQPRPLDLNELLTEFSQMLQRTLGEDIEFQFHYAPSLPSVWADPDMIEQVVTNLAVNARDAMPKGGTLLVDTAVVDIDEVYVHRHPEAHLGSAVCLTMIDTGCGMDQVTLSRIFEPFFTTKEFGKGTGLGLATVCGIVKQHQGWIEVQSQLGQGTTFKIYLPPGEPTAPSCADPATSAPVRGGHETILLVEDESPVRWTVRNVLERYGYRVLEASAGVEAMALWHQHHQDVALLLTDVVMPAGLNGQELAEQFKTQKPGLKVIYTSGYSVQTAGDRLELIDGLTFLQKPFDPARLALAVRNCLDGPQE
jgi:signal transduction histidine kinase/CheY-like chemotaxis protein